MSFKNDQTFASARPFWLRKDIIRVWRETKMSKPCSYFLGELSL